MQLMASSLGAMKRVDSGRGIRFTDEVKVKLAIVADAASKAKFRSETCQIMLESIVPGSAGSGLDERDSLQERALDIIGEVIEDLHVGLESDVKIQHGWVTDPDATKAELEKLAQLAEEGGERADDKAKEKEAALEAAEMALQACKDRLAAALKAVGDTRRNHKDKLQMLQSLENAYTQHFLPLKNGDFKSKSDADLHVKFLKMFFQQFGYEDSLMVAFQPASTRYPDSRRNFDNITMTEAEKGFLEKDHLEREVSDLEQAVVSREREQEAAADDVRAAEKSIREAGLEYGRALTDKNLANAKSADAAEKARTIPKTPQDAQKQLQIAERKLAAFMESPYAAYQWLKNRVAILEGRQRKRQRLPSSIGELIGRNIREVLPLKPQHRKLSIGVGWDALNCSDVDLDVSAIVFDDKGDHELCAVFSSKRTAPGITLSGDNLTGQGDGDDETIDINLDELKPEARQIYFALGVFTQKICLSDLTACHCRVVDKTSGTELVRYNTCDMEAHPGLILGRLYKDSKNQWHYQKIGLFSSGRTWFKMMPEILKARTFLTNVTKR
jgi:tellurium resistance protein TerZ